MLQENHGVMFLELLQQPPPLLHRQGLAGGDLTEELSEALQSGSLSLILVLLWRHLLAEGEHCNTVNTSGYHILVVINSFKEFRRAECSVDLEMINRAQNCF